MLLKGSCHCGSVTFELTSDQPYPFNRCYCSICRKTAGAGGYAINLGGDANSLKVVGQEHITIYHAKMGDQASPAERHFCRHCASCLWLYDNRWPDLIHPFASAIDTPLSRPPERTHMMLGSKADWVEPEVKPQDKCFDEYPDESLAEWHERLGFKAGD